MIEITAEISETDTAFLDTKVYKGDRFDKEAILDVRTNFKPTETFQCKNFYLCHPPGVTKGFIKGEALLIAVCVARVQRGGKGGKNERAKRVRVGDPFPPPSPYTSALLLTLSLPFYGLPRRLRF